MSASTSRTPAAVIKVLREMRTSSSPASPAGRASFKGLYQHSFDQEHESDENQCIGQKARHVEQLKGDANLETNAVGPSEQFGDE